MNNRYKILIVEDEENIRTLLSALVEANGYQAIEADDCEHGRSMFTSYVPDLIILDLGLPDDDGITLLKEIRKESLTPVIILSARSDEYEKVQALDLGANDYVTKPFGSAELVARIRSAIRNTRHILDDCPDGTFTTGDLSIDYGARRLFLKGEEIKLTQTEYNIVALLSEHCGKTLTYSSIIKAVWGTPDYGSTKKLQVNMANIRKKLGLKPGQNSYIVNELGVGYRMNGPQD